MPKCIDYARAESDDVVRKKFRRRIVWFVVATVVLVVITKSWIGSVDGHYWRTGSYFSKYPTITSGNGWIGLSGPTERFAGAVTNKSRRYGNENVGVLLSTNTQFNSPKWQFLIRYRILFSLAMIPWLITLIRMIRMWKRKRA